MPSASRRGRERLDAAPPAAYSFRLRPDTIGVAFQPRSVGNPAATELQGAHPMRLPQLLSVGNVADVEIAEVREDSRAVRKGDLFVAIKGQTADGHRYLAQAAAQGAAAVVVEEDVACDVPVVRVPSTRAALAEIAANRWGRPADRLKLIGVTGTNGKTTTAFL